MAEQNLGFLIYGKNDLRLEKLTTPEPQDHDVLLRMSHVGLCGSERPVIRYGSFDPGMGIKEPAVMGHEGCGIVAKCGSKVTNLKPGDRVAVIPCIPCEKCHFCKQGKQNVCPNLVWCVPPYNGILQRYVKYKADYCMKLPDNVSMEEGAMHEPLAVSVFACRRGKLTPASKVLICGAGSIGLLVLQVARTVSSNICALDIVDRKLEVARSLGATATINPKNVNEEDIENLVKSKLGDSPDVVFECSGSEVGIRLSVLAAQPGGKVIIVGVPAKNVNVPMYAALVKSVDLIMSFIFDFYKSFEGANALMRSGKVNLKPLITHRFKLEDAQKAYDIHMSGKGDPIKIMVSV